GYGSLDIYTIASNGLTLSPQTSTRGELPAPQGAASGVVGATMYTFNGLVFPGEAAVEAHTLDTSSGVLGSVAGSPAGDPTSRGGTSANVLFIPGLNLVTQTEQVTNSVASYSVTGGHFQLVNHAALDSSASYPASQTTIAHYLLVENGGSGTISACHLASNGISGCFMAATLTSNGGQRQPGGIGVIPA
ncbi:MAG: hypothetical protein M3Z66_05250, partial [Chloroflexota bacterium]|nr:hypothetical protein [Chloroflexota bacterium]